MTAQTHTQTTAQTTIRRLGERDADAAARLAELDSSVVPSAPLLGIEVEGRLLAVVSVRDGASIADPFSRTAELRALLELRATQLRERAHEGHGRAQRAPAETGLAASMPAGDGRLLSPHPRAF